MMRVSDQIAWAAKKKVLDAHHPDEFPSSHTTIFDVPYGCLMKLVQHEERWQLVVPSDTSHPGEEGDRADARELRWKSSLRGARL